MKLPRVQIPAGLATLPLVSMTLAALWLVAALVVGIVFRGDLAEADAQLRSVARQAIQQPELEIPGRLLPVARDLMPGFESNEMFAFLRHDDGGVQARFDARAEAALAELDGHPTRRLGLVPAQPAVHAFFSYALLHPGVLHALLTTAVFLLAAPVLERLWGWRVFLPVIVLLALAGSGAYVLVHYDADRALLGGGAILAGLVAGVLARFRGEEIDFLAWLPPAASAELVAPAWTLGAVWCVYELVAWLSMPLGVPGLAHAPGFVAHAGGALTGVAVSLGLERLGWERAPRVVEAKPAPAPRLDLTRIDALLEAGRGDEAFDLLEAAVRRNARHRDAVTRYFELCCEREEPQRAATALAQLVREELRRGAEEVAVARWQDLTAHAPDTRVDPPSLIRIATLLRRDGEDELAVVALQQVCEREELPASILAEAARLAAPVSSELARRTAARALGCQGLDAAVRSELEPLARGVPGEQPKDEDAPFQPEGRELPPNVFYEEQDRSAFGELEDLSAVEEFPAGAVIDAVPRAFDLEGFVLHAAERGELNVDYGRVRAVSVVGVHGLGPKPVLLIDVLVDGGGTERPLTAFRLRSDRFDPRSLAPGANGGIEALRVLVGQLLAGSEALPLPDAQAAVLRPPKLYESLAAYEQEVLAPMGPQLA